MYHHQQQVVVGSLSSAYALPRIRSPRVWGFVIPVLLASFQTQFYAEDRQGLNFTLWADFTNSRRPHIQEIDGAVNDTLVCKIARVVGEVRGLSGYGG
jgi:hypothetical protein